MSIEGDGGTLFLCKGQYKITSRLEPTTSVWLEGEGPEATVLLQSGDCDVLWFGTSVYFVALQGLRITGKDQGNISGNGVYLEQQINDYRMYDMLIDHMPEDGVYAKCIWTTVFEKCAIELNSGNGVTLTDERATYKEGSFIRCHLSGNDGYGALLSGTRLINFSDTRFSDNKESGAKVDVGASDDDVGNNRFNNCTFSGNYKHGIHLNDVETIVDKCRVTGNSYNNSGTYCGVYFDTEAYRCTVKNSRFKGGNIEKYGIHVAGGLYNEVSDNLFIYNTFVTAPLQNDKYNTVVERNRWQGGDNPNPIGVVSQPFQDATNFIGMAEGTSATPSASTDYEVVTSGIIISSTDSGDANCAIDIKDYNGNSVLLSTRSTLDGVYVPRGYTINWGAFTGTPPTVTVSFC